MSKDLYTSAYNPDVLNCLANLSNDEVFTPPEVANAMLDMLPQELFSNPDAKFLDPACKSGVFLREIAKRLIAGLAGSIPDLQQRLDHIFHKQIYGIGITALTSLLSRRSLYCSKHPNSKYSVSVFDTVDGNIRFKNTQHVWKNGKCIFCGAAKNIFDRSDEFENYAYEFIHKSNIHAIKEFFNVQFDVIIGNPPFQMNFGIEGGNSSNAKSIYNRFIDTAIKLNPKYICMIASSRWMTKTAQGISDSWVEDMLHSNKFKIIHDFENASDCFSGVSVKGGVIYFLWQNDYNGKCHYYFHQSQNKEVLYRYDFLDSLNCGIVIRNPKSFSIIEKIENLEGKYYDDSSKNFSGLVSPKHFFDNGNLLTSNWTDYKSVADSTYNIKYYLNINGKRSYKWIADFQIPKNKAAINFHKVFIPAAGGSGFDEQVLGKPFYGEPGSVCSQTYLVIGYDNKFNFTKNECLNILSYIKTRFFRYLVSIKKKTQNGPRGVYQFVPLQDFSKPWTDEELYKKYNLTDEEIAFIESMIKPMELGGEE